MPEDPFATPAADPFAGPADEISAEPIPEPGEPDEQFPAPHGDPQDDPMAGIPVVNAEGEVVVPAAASEPTPEPPAPAVEPAPPAEVAADAQVQVLAAEAAAAVPVPAVTPSAPAPAPPAATTGATTTDAAPAPPQRPTGPRGGKGEMRHYKLLYMSGPDTWTQADLASVPNDSGVVVCKVTPQKELDEISEKKGKLQGTDLTAEQRARITAEIDYLERLHKELWFEARNNEHANRLGYTIMDRPQDGAYIFPVPRGAWKPKHVKPAPPQPERERVVIY